MQGNEDGHIPRDHVYCLAVSSIHVEALSKLLQAISAFLGVPVKPSLGNLPVAPRPEHPLLLATKSIFYDMCLFSL